MKKISILSLALIAGLCFGPPAILAQDQVPAKGDTKGAAALPHAGKRAAQGGPALAKGPQQGVLSRGLQPNPRIAPGATTRGIQSRGRPVPGNNVTSQGYPQAAQGQSSRRQTQAYAVQGNRDNNYGGRWSPANSHSDWDQQSNHRWNNHEYGWYNGGWLIIDPGYSLGYNSPGYYSPGYNAPAYNAPAYNAPGYNASGSVGSNVQASLAQQGYYHGPIDGDIGRGTRHAIAQYESDNGLQVNGRIDEPLLVSLRLE